MTNYSHIDCHDDRHDYGPPVILACGTGSGLIIPDHDEEESNLFSPYVLASVTLDASRLNNPTIKIDFSAVITYREKCGSSDLRLVFQLSKIPATGSKVGLGSWNFERDFSGVNEAELTDSFSFTFCTCNECPACYTYVVELINVESNDVDFAAITASNITALAANCPRW